MGEARRGGEEMPINSDAVEQVRLCEDAWYAALPRADVQGLRALMHEKSTISHGSGVVEGREAFLSTLFSRLEFKRSAMASVDYLAFGEVVLVMGVLEQTVRLIAAAGDFTTGRANITRAWVRDGSRWLLLRHHGTRLGDQRV